MLKVIKRCINRVKEKLGHSFGGPDLTTLATRPVVQVPYPEPSHSSFPTSQPPPVVATPHTEPGCKTPHLELFHRASTPANQVLIGTSMGAKSSQCSDPLAQTLEQFVSSTPGPEDTDNTEFSPMASMACGNKRGSKSIAWSGLRTLMGVLHDSIDAFGPLKFALSGLSRCIDIYENRVVAHKEYIQLQAHLNNLCQSISQHLGGTMPPSMTPCIEILVREIKIEVDVVIQKLERNMVQSCAEAMEDHDEILRSYRRIHALLSQLSLNADMSIWKTVDAEATRMRLKELPNSPAAEYNSAQSEGLGRAGCTPNTRVDVLAQLHLWTRGHKSLQKLYWLNGMAGTGKTTIAYSLCQQLSHDGRLAASFFCSRQLPSCRDVGVILPSIAYQLSMFSYPFRSALSHALETQSGIHNQPVAQQFESLIVAPLRKIEKSLPVDLVIVIDALDECEDASRVDKLLFTLVKHAKVLPVRIFLASRPDPQIVDQMRGEFDEHVRHELRLHELGRSIVESDIKLFLTAELASLKLQDFELRRLSEQSGVLFVYAATIVRYIKHDHSARCSQRLKRVLGTSTLSNHSHRKVDELYHAILEAALLDQELDISERKEIKKVLHTVICAQEPLSVNVIARLLDLDVQSVTAALRPLLSVLQVASTTGLVTTLHESFPEYMLDPERSKEFHCNAGSHNAWFAQACFDHITAINICNLESSYIQDTEVHDLGSRIESAIPQHLFYSCKYWEAHIELMDISDAGMNKLFQFLSERLLLWMEIMNLKKNMYAAVGMLSRLHIWLSSIQSSSATRALVLDAVRFINAYASSPIQYFTPHIYVSALSLWPSERPITKYYSRRIKGLALAWGTAMQRQEGGMLAKRYTPDTIHCVTYSPNGAQVASGGADNDIHIWDAYAGQMVHRLEGHRDSVWSVSFSPDGTHVVSGSGDRTIRIWDTHTWQIIGPPLDGHAATIYSVAYSPNGIHLVSGSEDKTIRIWNVRTRQILGQPITGHTGTVFSVAYSPDSRQIVSGSDDCTVRIWDAHTRQMLGLPLLGHTGWVRSVTYSPDGLHIASGSEDKTICVWDLHNRQLVGQPITGHTNSVHSVAYSPDGNYIASGSRDCTVRIWSSHTRRMLGPPLLGHTDWIQSAKYSPDGMRIISGSSDRTIRIWDAHAEQTLGRATDGHTDSVTCVTYSPDGSLVASGSEDRTICIWDPRTGQMIGQPLNGHEAAVYSVAYSPDGTQIVSGSKDKTIRIWDTNTGKAVGKPLVGHTEPVSSVSYSPDGVYIASGSWDKTICIWNALDGRMVGQPLRDHTNRVCSVSYSSDGKHIISSSDDRTVRIWDVQTGDMIGKSLAGHEHEVNSIAHLPEEKHIDFGSRIEAIRIGGVCASKTPGQPLEVFKPMVNPPVAYSSDGSGVVSGSGDGTIRIWDAITLQQLSYSSQSHKRSNRDNSQTLDSSDLVSSSSSANSYDYKFENILGSPIISSSDPNAWIMSEDGWVVNRDLQPLLWVPPELRGTLLRYGNTCLISRNGSWKLIMDEARFGTDWSELHYA